MPRGMKVGKMVKIICTSLREKTELIEASQYLASLKGVSEELKCVSFLKNLYKNPGDIEIMEDGINVQRSRNHQSTPKRFGAHNKLFDL